MQQAILKKYTAVDMKAIDTWFSQHPDAVLVTDKINQPIEFVAQFSDPSRLMMELFSWRAIKAAQQLNLKAVIPSGDLILKIPGDKAAYLQNQGIEYLAASRRWADSSPNLLRQLNLAGFKIFAFQQKLLIKLKLHGKRKDFIFKKNCVSIFYFLNFLDGRNIIYLKKGKKQLFPSKILARQRPLFLEIGAIDFLFHYFSNCDSWSFRFHFFTIWSLPF